jgi:hypothetical protein
MSEGVEPVQTAESGSIEVSPFAGVSVRQGRAIEALLAGVTILRAAEAAGVNERTVRTWLKRHRFRLALFDARREAFAQAIGLTQKFAPNAIGVLAKVMNDPASGPTAKVMAATALLKFGRESLELDDVNVRVEQLEAVLAEALPAPKRVHSSIVQEKRS